MIRTKELLIYKTRLGNKPFIRWLNKLKDRIAKAKIRRRIDRLSLGDYGDCKTINGKLKELRIHYGPGYRVYFTEVENMIVILLLGGVKGTQNKDIIKASVYLNEIMEKINENEKITATYE